MMSLLAAMVAVLARMFSLFSRKVIASEQPLHTNAVASDNMDESIACLSWCACSVSERLLRYYACA